MRKRQINCELFNSFSENRSGNFGVKKKAPSAAAFTAAEGA